MYVKHHLVKNRAVSLELISVVIDINSNLKDWYSLNLTDLAKTIKNIF